MGSIQPARLFTAHTPSWQLLKVTTFDRYLRFKVKDIQMAETVRLPAASVAAGRTITGTTLVIDAHGLVR